MNNAMSENPLQEKARELIYEIDEAIKRMSHMTEIDAQIALEASIKLMKRELREIYCTIGQLSMLVYIQGKQ